MSSELENEGVRAILRRLDAMDKRLNIIEESIAGINEGNVCWTWVDKDGAPTLAGQTFANAMGDIAEDVVAIHKALSDGSKLSYSHIQQWLKKRW